MEKTENSQKPEREKVNQALSVPTYYVEMLFQDQPQMEAKPILKGLLDEFSDVTIISDTKDFIVFSLHEPDWNLNNSEEVPKVVLSMKEPKINAQRIDLALDQTWDWAEKEKVVKACRYKVLVSDFKAENLSADKRVQMFNKVMKVLLTQCNASALHWVTSLKIVSPQTYLAALGGGDTPDYLYGALNVRLFVVDQESGEFLMDTMGLAAFGLPDLQCHFKGLNPEEVAGVLINYGYYIFEKGDVIEDGHTIQGIDEDQKWKCVHEYSMAIPQRIVLDLNPGKEFSGGMREETES